MSVAKVSVQRKGFAEAVRHYEHTDSPVCLRLLLKGALTMGRGVLLVWLDAADAENAARVAVADIQGECVVARTETGAVKRVALWDVWEAILLDEEAVAS